MRELCEGREEGLGSIRTKSGWRAGVEVIPADSRRAATELSGRWARTVAENV